MAAYQKGFIETQSMEDRSKNPEQSLALSGTALPSANRKPRSGFSKPSPRDIQAQESKRETFTPRWVAPAPAQRCWGLHGEGMTGSSFGPRAPARSHHGPALAPPQREPRKSPVSIVWGAITAEAERFPRWLFSLHNFHQRSNKKPNYSMCIHASSHTTNPYTNEWSILTFEF